MRTKANAFCMFPGVFLLVKKKQVENVKSADCRIRGSLHFLKNLCVLLASGGSCRWSH